MMSTMLLASIGIFFLLGSCSAEVRQLPLAKGACLCVGPGQQIIGKSAGLLRSSNSLGIADAGECFEFTGRTSMNDSIEWVSINFKGQEGWAARTYMKEGNRSMCSSNVDTCANRGGLFNQKCLACICQIESGCKPIGCHMDVGSLSCGYYQIKLPYYTDCYSPGSGWKTCSDDYGCASQCVNNYISRYYKYCTGSSTPACCEDAARIHNGGPHGCQKSATLGYWKKIQQCLNQD